MIVSWTDMSWSTVKNARESQAKLVFRRVLDGIKPVVFEPKQVPGLQHMRRQWRAGVDHAAARMRDHDPASQQMQPVLQAARQLPVLAVEIFWVAHDRVIDMRHMRAQLMRPPGHRL